MKTYILAAIAGLSFGNPLSACAWNPPVNIGDARAAELVFEGRLIDRTSYSFADRPTEVAYMTATFDVLSVLKGDPGQQVTVVIGQQMLGVPVDLNRLPDRVFVATTSATPEGWLQPHALPDLPILVHPTCGTGFLIPATQANRAEIEATISAP